MSLTEQKRFIEVSDEATGTLMEFESVNANLCLFYLKQYFPRATGLLYIDEGGSYAKCDKDARVISIPGQISKFIVLDDCND